MERARQPAGCVALAMWAACLCGPIAVAAPPTPPPAAAFASLPGIQVVAISPNGRLLAQDDVKGEQRRIVIWDVDTARTLRVVNVDAANKIRGLEWADDETLLLDASVSHADYCTNYRRCQYEIWRTVAIGMDGSPARMLLMNDTDRKWVTGAHRLSTHPARPHSVTMQTLDYLATRQSQGTGTRLPATDLDRSGWTSIVFDVDTRTGEARPLASGTQYTQQWIVDLAGDPIARSEWVASRDDFAVLARQGGGWREVLRQKRDATLDLGGVTMDGKAIVVIGSIGSERSKAWVIPLDGSPMSVLYEDPAADVKAAVLDPYTNAVVGLAVGVSDDPIHWLDAKQVARHRSLASAFGGKRVLQIGRSADGQRVLVMVGGPSLPPTYHLVDFDKSRADVVGDAYPALAGAALGSTRFIHYPARDGVSIPAYLTLPPGREARNLPLVVLPHDGPEDNDSGSFDYLVQFLATRGYAVLQPQFRGSTGFGDAFRRAGYRQWGGLMQDDVTDGVRHLAAEGTVNPAKVCIAGVSYGGYAALAGAAFTPDLYTCVVSINGVSDLPAMLVTISQRVGKDSAILAYWNDHIGLATDPNVAVKSPARSAATVKAPVLLLHGAEDSVVPIDQSERMAQALQKAGRSVTLVRLPGEDHWLSRSATRLQVLQELETFLAKYLN